MRKTNKEIYTIACSILKYRHENAAAYVNDSITHLGFSKIHVLDPYYYCMIRRFKISLYHVPQEMRSEEICLAAVQNDGRALYHVPQDKRSAILQKLFATISQLSINPLGLPLATYKGTHDAKLRSNPASEITCLKERM